MTPTPEKAAPIPAADILDGFRPAPAIDSALFVSPERMRFLVARATMPYSTADDVERSIREAIEDTVRVIKQHLADREARPSLPDSREEQIGGDGQGFVQLPDGWLAIELRAVEEELEKWPAGLRASFESLLQDRTRARQGGNNG